MEGLRVGFASGSSRSGFAGSAGIRFNRRQCTHAETAELLKIWNVWAPATYKTSDPGVELGLAASNAGFHRKQWREACLQGFLGVGATA